MELPGLIRLEDSGGNINGYLEKLYNIYCSNIVDASLTFLGLKIVCPWHPPHDNKHCNFWHIISKDGEILGEENRNIDFRRCERLNWIPTIINEAHSNHTDIWCWENQRKGKKNEKTHTVLYLHNEKYMLVLRENRYTYQLVTAYPVEREHHHVKLTKEKQLFKDPRKSKGRP